MKQQFIILISALLFAVILCGAASANGGLENVYVATDGNDSWDGSQATPGPGNIGPVQSVEVGLIKVTENGTVNLAAGTYNKTESGHSDVDLSIGRNVTLQGAGSGVTFIDAMGLSKIFCISDVKVLLKDLTLKNGNSDYGGAINNQGTLTLNNCAFENNHANTNGGSLYSINEVNIQNCQFNSNYAGSGIAGGAVYIQNGNASISNSQFNGNHAEWDGGAVYINNGEVSISNCIFNGNYADEEGGAIWNRGDLTVTDSQFTGNYVNGGKDSGMGGAIFSGFNSILKVTDSTFSGNTATDNGAIHMEGGSFQIIGNNIINNNGSGINIHYGPSGASTIVEYRNINVNRIFGNSEYGVYLHISHPGLIQDNLFVGTQLPLYMVNATNNWWGSNSNPKDNPDNIGGEVDDVNADPWLILTISANPNSIPFGGTSAVTASLTTNSNGEDTSSIGHIPDGTIIEITTDIGNVGSKSVDVGTVNGIATALLRANDGFGTAHLFAMLDGFWTPVPANVVITQAASTVNAKTVGMQTTGIPLAGIALAIFMVIGGFYQARKK
jgi:autotransporter family porin